MIFNIFRRDKPVRQIFTKVVGVTHDNPDGTTRQIIIERCRVGERLALVREPENPVDNTAVAVYRLSGQKIGYLSRDLAPEIFADLEDDIRVDAEISDLTGGTPTRPTRGVNIRISRYR